jgi:hypothetical protein
MRLNYCNCFSTIKSIHLFQNFQEILAIQLTLTTLRLPAMPIYYGVGTLYLAHIIQYQTSLNERKLIN